MSLSRPASITLLLFHSKGKALLFATLNTAKFLHGNDSVYTFLRQTSVCGRCSGRMRPVSGPDSRDGGVLSGASGRPDHLRLSVPPVAHCGAARPGGRPGCRALSSSRFRSWHESWSRRKDGECIGRSVCPQGVRIYVGSGCLFRSILVSKEVTSCF